MTAQAPSQQDTRKPRFRKLYVLWGVALTLVATGAITLGLLVWCGPRNVLAVDNASGRTVRSFAVTICNKDHVLSDLVPGVRQEIPFSVSQDSDFLIRVNCATRATGLGRKTPIGAIGIE